MSDPALYTYASPLKGYEKLPPLGEELAEDGRSIFNPATGIQSEAYQKFTSGISNGRRGGFDVHIYYHGGSATQTRFAKELRERIRREFPELRIYKLWDRPIGPHTLPMFEVNLFTPEQFGAFIPWLVINRGPLSVLLHPNCDDGDDLRDHSQRATWLGERVPVDLNIFKRSRFHYLFVLLFYINYFLAKLSNKPKQPASKEVESSVQTEENKTEAVTVDG